MSVEQADAQSKNPVEEEGVHLQEVLGIVGAMVSKLQALPRYFQEDTSEPQTADEVAQQTVERLRDEQIHNLTLMRSEPYFGRLDFQASDEHRPEALYIGKRGIEDTRSGDRLVIDWRAPIASLFYSFTGGDKKAEYESPQGIIEGEVALKRNILVRDGQLQRVVDSYVKGQDEMSVTDEFLLYRLGEQKDSRLRDIVSTIQSEQDKIIRAERQKAIFIQGVAGSGKTTVALHRIAYLLYQHQDRLKAHRMVIFAPNSMFVDYISEVLPELGVGGIKQTTFNAWALEVLNLTVKLEDPAQRLQTWFEDDASAGNSTTEGTNYRGSLQFMNDVDTYLLDLESTVVPNDDFSPWDNKSLPKEEIERWFNEEYSHYPLGARIERVLGRVKRWYEMELSKSKPAHGPDPRRKTAASRYRTYTKRWPALTAHEIYQAVTGVSFNAPGGKGQRRTARPVVTQEDLAGIVYIQSRIADLARELHFDHVVIDEAQDFSPLQIQVLKQFCPSGSFTILGDLSQSIHTYQGITSWNEFFQLFPDDARQYYELNVSYRSTTEIIEFANSVLRPFPGFTEAQPVFRSGEKVVVEQVLAKSRHHRAVDAVKKLAEKANTVAVVCRKEADCRAYHKALTSAGVEAHLITARDQHYAGGISVLPVYLTKGLEFDAVLLVDVNKASYDLTALSAKLLYVGCTRALHSLWLQISDEPSPLLDDDAREDRAV